MIRFQAGKPYDGPVCPHAGAPYRFSNKKIEKNTFFL
jgi:hypothetical protein